MQKAGYYNGIHIYQATLNTHIANDQGHREYAQCVIGHTIAGAAVGANTGLNDRYSRTVGGAGTGFITGTRICSNSNNGGSCNIF